MFGRRAAITSHRTLWLLLTGALMLVGAVQALRAAATPTEDNPPALAAASTAEPSPEPTLMMETPVDSAPLVSEPATVAPAEPDPLPTEIMPTVEQATSIPTQVMPTDTPDPVDPTQVAPTVTFVAPDSAIPTEPPPAVTAWPTEASVVLPNLQLIAGPAPANAGEPQSVLLVGNKLASVYSLALSCQVDPAHLQGVGASTTGLFAVAGTLLDTGFLPSGQWLLVWSRTLADADSPAPTELMRLDFQPLAAGVTSLACQVYAGDAFGMPLAEVPLSVDLTIDESPIALLPETELTPLPESTEAPMVELTQESTAEATEAEPERIIITPEITDAELLPERIVVTPEVADTTPITEVDGEIAGNALPTDVEMVWDGAAMQQRSTPDSDGAFSVLLLSGEYQLTITAAHHLPYEALVLVADGRLTLPPIALTNGDIDSNGAVDAADVDLLVASFGQRVPEAPASADLNDDGLVDLYDLAILGANLTP